LLLPVRAGLDEVKAVGRRHDATVNDVVLASVSAGLRALFLARGERPAKALNALVPVSRRRPEHRGTGGNQVTAILVHLPVDEPDAVSRLARICEQTRELKRSPDGAALAALLGWADALPPGVMAPLSRLVHHQPFVNIVVTNVAGPTVPLSLLGAEMTDIVPIVPLARNLSLGVAALSYRGQLVVGLHADASACPDIAVVAEEMARAMR
jgi:diacylglycerol O-acyltransferase / wax synthase